MPPEWIWEFRRGKVIGVIISSMEGSGQKLPDTFQVRRIPKETDLADPEMWATDHARSTPGKGKRKGSLTLSRLVYFFLTS